MSQKATAFDRFERAMRDLVRVLDDAQAKGDIKDDSPEGRLRRDLKMALMIYDDAEARKGEGNE
jgi:hypothetical protein